VTGALVSAARHAVLVVNWIVLGYFLLSNGFQAVLMTAAATDIRHRARAGWSEQLTLLLSSPAAPTVSVLAPAHNEAATIAASVRALLALRYPRLQVVVINDGSTDGTLEALRHQFALVPVHPILRLSVPTAAVRGLYHSLTAPALLVVDKANGGKADALNAGVNAAAGELLCAIDADTLIEPDALLRVVRPFLGRGDVVASGGTIRVANDCVVRSGRVVTARAPRRLLPGVQAVEYLRAFLFGRLGWNRLGGNLIISGAFGLFRRDAVLTAGGYAADTVGEDMELVVRLRRRGIEAGGPAEVVFVPDPVAWTEVPESVRVLGRQRDRWQRGLADVLVRHRRLIGNPRYGALGLVGFPYFVVIELVGPVIEALGVVALGLGLALHAVDPAFTAVFLLATYGMGVPLSLAAILLDQVAYRRCGRLRDRALLFGWAFAENLGYRQLSVFWRLRGLVRYLRGSREWGVMARRGFEPATAARNGAEVADVAQSCRSGTLDLTSAPVHAPPPAAAATRRP